MKTSLGSLFLGLLTQRSLSREVGPVLIVEVGPGRQYTGIP